MYTKTYSGYIMTNRTGTLYIGATSDLMQRVYQHKTKQLPGFTLRYNLDRLVYYEQLPTADRRSRGSLRSSDQGMAAEEEDRIDRVHESGLEGLVSGVVCGLGGEGSFASLRMTRWRATMTDSRRPFTLFRCLPSPPSSSTSTGP
jgi:hypothetical protein